MTSKPRDREFDDEGRRWYAVRVEVRGELRVQSELRQLGFDAYCPCETKWVRHARRKDAVNRPYIPRYLFVGIFEGQGFHQIHGVRGVECIIGTLGQPIPVDFDWVETMRHAEAIGWFDETIDRNRLVIEPGKPVRVIAGPFKGFMAKIVEAKGEGRVKVLLEAMGRVAPGTAELDTDKLEAA